MRLSHGFVRGESLACIYHGWRYGPDGGCQHIPAHPNVVPPKTINCGPLPVAEHNGVIWVAAKRPAQAPTTFAGFEALRSLAVAAPEAAIRRAAQGTEIDGGIRTQLAGNSAILLLSPREGADAVLIALIEAESSLPDKLAASDALEALRRAAESEGGDR